MEMTEKIAEKIALLRVEETRSRRDRENWAGSVFDRGC
jgi:hypothetical protein